MDLGGRKLVQESRGGRVNRDEAGLKHHWVEEGH